MHLSTVCCVVEPTALRHCECTRSCVRKLFPPPRQASIANMAAQESGSLAAKSRLNTFEEAMAAVAQGKFVIVVVRSISLLMSCWPHPPSIVSWVLLGYVGIFWTAIVRTAPLMLLCLPLRRWSLRFGATQPRVMVECDGGEDFRTSLFPHPPLLRMMPAGRTRGILSCQQTSPLEMQWP